MITIIAMFEIKPECVDAFKELAAPCIEASRLEEGNESYNLSELAVEYILVDRAPHFILEFVCQMI